MLYTLNFFGPMARAAGLSVLRAGHVPAHLIGTKGNTSKMRKLLLAGAAALLPLAFGTAHATAITTSSDLVVTWSQLQNGVTLSAVAELNNFQFHGTSVSFTLTVDNTTTATNDVRFTSFGWDTSPASTASSDNNNAIFATTTNVGLSGVALSVCFYGGQNCNGGSNGGLEDPANAGLHNDPTGTTAQVTIDFGQTTVPPLDFSNFDGKFQTDFGSFEFTGTVCTTGCTSPPPPPDPVPEPASIALLGVGLLGLGTVIHRRRR
jgi:hypothetical protein